MQTGTTCLCVVLATIAACNAEVFTSMAHVVELGDTEAVLMKTLEDYIAVQENKIETLKRHLSEFAREHKEASNDVSSYVSNPITAFSLVRRLTSGWKQIESVMVDDTGDNFIENITAYQQTHKFPTEEDLSGAAVALVRLQDTYQLDTASVASGLLNGVQYPTEMTSSDCFELGRQSYNNQDFYYTVLWMKEALRRHEEEPHPTTSKALILDYMAFSTYKEGDVQNALKLTEQQLKIVPNDVRALANRAGYIAELKAKGEQGTQRPPDVPLKTRRIVNDLPDRDVYEALCRGDLNVDAEIASRLKCRYVHNNIPFLRIAPFKQEEAFLKPFIVLYHDVISDDEINTIKKLSQPRFERASVFPSANTVKRVTTNVRISKSAWLSNHEHQHIYNVHIRSGDMASLSLSTVEDLQVVNYGIGGQYEPHVDFARKGEDAALASMSNGNRIGTVLFYMSDVSQGGATVFPELKVSLFPRKGSAAFWYNLHKDGEGDLQTRHAGCPVLSGSKWVCNKWFHQIGQEFVRPCGLTPDSETSLDLLQTPS